MKIEGVDNIEKKGPIDAVTIAVSIGEPGNDEAIEGSFLVFKKGEDQKNRAEYAISALPDFLNNEDNELPEAMKERIADHIPDAILRKKGKDYVWAAADQSLWRTLAGAATNAASALVNLGGGGVSDSSNREVATGARTDQGSTSDDSNPEVTLYYPQAVQRYMEKHPMPRGEEGSPARPSRRPNPR